MRDYGENVELVEDIDENVEADWTVEYVETAEEKTPSKKSKKMKPAKSSLIKKNEEYVPQRLTWADYYERGDRLAKMSMVASSLHISYGQLQARSFFGFDWEEYGRKECARIRKDALREV